MRDAASKVDVPPPEFLRLAGNPVRWRLLRELARSDRRVGELTALVERPQNAVSYHLGQLRAGGLVSVRRSSADARDGYYRIELGRCRALLAATGAALHPGLAGMPAPLIGRRRVRVLFLCTGNSARSQIAEALLRQGHGWIGRGGECRKPSEAGASERGPGDARVRPRRDRPAK